ncbi:hypothetical protein [Bacillus thuringiensis]|uniref:hypothetical protein n=1 Tax=Bacillus thuringiensis TaxID=1428 RepID=UPI0021D664F0|nr:hypothetical protein [Bacillus thuringiensis]MCU7666747.1 hypothetical protein [Bacillus thuringiensis]
MATTAIKEQTIKAIDRENKESLLVISNRKDNKAVILTFRDFKEKKNNRMFLTLSQNSTCEVIRELESYIQLWGRTLEKDEKAYWEEISVFSKGVERTIGIRPKEEGIELDLVCYTDKIYDDNWIGLTPTKAVRLLNLLYGYVKSWIVGGDRICPSCEEESLVEKGLTKWMCLNPMCKEEYESSFLDDGVELD